ncbi:uncharacterized mitochondrial protein AtMg00810-like [Ziziphus jujuba]|uniref:Uncharacterized mitochondrial protein AtMg00810-like n=1 Tax=Ziziphus jujuba TaxID=326968 RepID=A0A6P4AQP2_ZIZJJ|nr:uncharacterized mitochondrial protein AtMg00810-like [Ziziphus jujuba]
MLIVTIYVDDIVYTGNEIEMLKCFKEDMMRKYEMTNLGLLHHFLGMGVIQTTSSIFVQQKKYASALLNKFGLTTCNPVLTPLITNDKLSKDDASLLARFMHCPTNKDFGTAKRVLRYIKGTLDYGLEYVKGKQPVLVGYCDSDWCGSVDDMRSTSGYAFSFGSGVFSWASVKKNYVALSTIEAEYISASKATAQAIWLRFVLEDFGEMQL